MNRRDQVASGAAQWTMGADPTAPATARGHVASWMAAHGAAQRAIDDMSLVASELVANVVQHGDATELRVRLDASDPSRWTLEVVGGRAPLPPSLRDPSTWVVAGPESRHGRGLGIVREVVDEVEVAPTAEGLAIRCHRRR